MKNKLKRKVVTLATFAVLIFLFCGRVTGVPVHIIAGLGFMIALTIHTWRRRKYILKCQKAYRITDIVTFAAMLGIFISGMMLKPFKDVMAVLLLHKICSVIFGLGLLLHIKQHMPICKGGKKS